MLSLIYPIKRLHIPTRKVAGIVVGASIAVFVLGGLVASTTDRTGSKPVAATADATTSANEVIEKVTATPKPENTPKPTSTPKPENTPKPTATVKAENTATPTSTPKPPTSTPAPPSEIRGVTSGGIKVALEKEGYKCSGPDQGLTMVFWTCKWSSGRLDVAVDFMGSGPTRIRSVDETVTDMSAAPSPANALSPLMFLATLPYDDGQPEAAREWVRTNNGTTAETVFGSARFNLYGKDRVWVLEMIAIGAK